MKKLIRSLQRLALASLLCISLSAHAEILSGRVVGVADGDTITILNSENTQHKIRLSGIDSPEKSQPFGNVSKKSLSSLVYGKQVSVDWHKTDRYNRIIGKVIVSGLDANLEQVKRGLAWHYKKYQKEQPFEDRESYNAAEKEASLTKVGLWIDIDPIAPWDFRKQKRNKFSN